MSDAISIQYNKSLRPYNTFGIDAYAYAYLEVTSADVLPVIKEVSKLATLPRLILGGGSNLLLTRDFSGLVLHMRTQGIQIVGEDEEATYVKVAAGENWHQFVQWTLDRELPGLENLSLIPGSVGAAPIQNIGAYGAELKDFFHTLTAFDFVAGNTFVLNKAGCHFGYRDSAFKHALFDRAVILDVTFALPKQWKANVKYADVAQELAVRGIGIPTARDISEAVVAIRSRKLPDPRVIGNAGSFFKNPVISAERRDVLLRKYPTLVSYEQPDGRFKLAAGWLIDQCGWKGKRVGDGGVYEKQALVLVNHGNASGQEVVELAQAIQRDVQARFGVLIEPEPVFI